MAHRKGVLRLGFFHLANDLWRQNLPESYPEKHCSISGNFLGSFLAGEDSTCDLVVLGAIDFNRRACDLFLGRKGEHGEGFIEGNP